MSKLMPTRSEKEKARLISRRDLIKYATFVGAALGLPRWKVFEVLETTGGKALAAEAACATTNRSVHIVAGAGGFAWFQLLWPHNDVAAAGNANFAFHAPGQQTLAQGTDKPLTFGPEAPWKNLLPRRQVTAIIAGTNETHTQQPASATTVALNTSLMAAAAAMQSVNPTLVPVIAIDNTPFGTATGAPRAARVNSADAIVDLFNSAASRAGGALSQAQDAALFETAYKGFLALHAAAGRPTMARTFGTGKVAANLLGQNLAERLRPTDADLARYGIGPGQQNKIVQIGKALIVAVKAFQMGLTSSIILPAMRDDPHGAFNDLANLRSTVEGLGKVLDEFMKDAMAIEDPTCAGSKLGENLVVTIHGDTPKTPLNRGGWPDGTPGNSNWMYVLGAGYLKSGWFGGILRDGTVRTWNPATGEDNGNMTSGQLAAPASAAVLYAVSKGDMRRVQDFYRGTDISGIIRPAEM